MQTKMMHRQLVRAALISLCLMAGCAADQEQEEEGSDPEASRQGEALEVAGDTPPECDSDGCGPETLVASEDEPPPELKIEKTISGRSVILTASTAGAKLTANLVWVNNKKFELHNVRLTDASCDDKSVYFHTHIPGFQYPDHANKTGCNTTTTWSSLAGSSSGKIYSLWLEVCRNKNPDNCATSQTALNPYY